MYGILIIILTALGALLSLYMFIVEQKVEEDEQYKASCDLSDKISCTTALRSPYGKPFGISNSLLGTIFYPIVLFLSLSGNNVLVFYASIGACVASIILAYVQHAKIRIFCIICSSLYIVNGALLIVSYLHL